MVLCSQSLFEQRDGRSAILRRFRRNEETHDPDAQKNLDNLDFHWNIRRSFFASIFAVSTPGTFFRSSIDLNLPFFSRYLMIAAACERLRDNPLSRSIASALLTSIPGTSSAGKFFTR